MLLRLKRQRLIVRYRFLPYMTRYAILGYLKIANRVLVNRITCSRTVGSGNRARGGDRRALIQRRLKKGCRGALR